MQNIHQVPTQSRPNKCCKAMGQFHRGDRAVAGEKSHLLLVSCCLVSWGASAGAFQAEGALDCVAHRRVSRSMSLSWVFSRVRSDGTARRLLSGVTDPV